MSEFLDNPSVDATWTLVIRSAPESLFFFRVLGLLPNIGPVPLCGFVLGACPAEQSACQWTHGLPPEPRWKGVGVGVIRFRKRL
jgi:hypothetical protein